MADLQTLVGRQIPLFIDGEECASESGLEFDSVNPANGEPWASAAQGRAADAHRAVRAARKALQDPNWSNLTGSERGRLLRRLADLVREHSDRLAELDTIDTGRIIGDTKAVALATAATIEYFAGWADKFDGRVVPVERRDMFNYTLREPIGVVAALVPWNNPLIMLGFKLGPSLAMGNAVVVKPSEHSPATAVELARLAAVAGFPPGVVNVVTGFGDVGQALCAEPGVDKIAFTGSPEHARSVAHAAADHLGLTMFELGGKSANIVFADADYDSALNGAMTIFAGTGQSCVAPSRLLVEKSIYSDFVAEIQRRAGELRMGDPLDPATEMGPVGTPQQLAKNGEFCAAGIAEGAKLVCGGSRPSENNLKDGWFFEPTIFAAQPEMHVAQVEAFGPILTVLAFEDEADALRVANGTRYGLAAGVWTTNLARAHRLASQLNAGTVWVNTYRNISYASPFGGNKDSGYGRENGPEALWEYTRAKSVWIDLSGKMADPFRWKS